MTDRRRLAVHLRLGARDRGAVRLADHLMTETDAEDRRGGTEPPDDLERHAGLIGVAGSGRDHHALRLERGDRVAGQRVVAYNLEARAELAQVLHEVVR